MLLLKLLTPEDLQQRDHFFRGLEPKSGFQGPLTILYVGSVQLRTPCHR